MVGQYPKPSYSKVNTDKESPISRHIIHFKLVNQQKTLKKDIKNIRKWKSKSPKVYKLNSSLMSSFGFSIFQKNKEVTRKYKV